MSCLFSDSLEFDMKVKQCESFTMRQIIIMKRRNGELCRRECSAMLYNNIETLGICFNSNNSHSKHIISNRSSSSSCSSDDSVYLQQHSVVAVYQREFSRSGEWRNVTPTATAERLERANVQTKRNGISFSDQNL